MKYYLSVLVAALFLVGCATFYTTTVSMTAVVDSAMKNWAELSVQGKTTPALDARVTLAHDKYRAACGVAQAALIAYKQTGDQDAYIQALTAARTAADGLFDILLPLFTKAEAAELSAQLQKANAL